MRLRRLASIGIAAWLVALAVVAAPPRALAADVSFGKPSAVADYGKAITFTVDVTRDVPLDRVELRLSFPDTLGPLIVDVPVPDGTGTDTLQYVLDVTGGGHIVPNTPIEATWAAFTAPGADPVTSRDDRVLYEDTTHEWKTVVRRPDDRPLVSGWPGLRQQGARDRRAGDPRHLVAAGGHRDRAGRLLHLRRPGLVPRRTRAGHARERRRAGALRHPDAVRADHPRGHRPALGRRRGPARARPSRIRHRPSTIPIGSRRGG